MSCQLEGMLVPAPGCRMALGHTMSLQGFGTAVILPLPTQGYSLGRESVCCPNSLGG